MNGQIEGETDKEERIVGGRIGRQGEIRRINEWEINPEYEKKIKEWRNEWRKERKTVENSKKGY